MVVLDALSKAAVSKLQCQQCFGPLNTKRLLDIRLDSVHVIVERTIRGSGSSIEQLKTKQEKGCGDLRKYAQEENIMLVYEKRLSFIVRCRNLPVYVPPTLISQELKHANNSNVTGHYQKRRTIARLKGMYWWRGGLMTYVYHWKAVPHAQSLKTWNQHGRQE